MHSQEFILQEMHKYQPITATQAHNEFISYTNTLFSTSNKRSKNEFYPFKIIEKKQM